MRSAFARPLPRPVRSRVSWVWRTQAPLFARAPVDFYESDGRPTRRQAAVDAAVGLLYLLVVLPPQWEGPPVAGVLLGLALALRRLLVPAMVALAVGAGVLQLATQALALPADLAYPLLFYSLGRHPVRQWRRTGLVTAAVATAIGPPWMAWQGHLGLQWVTTSLILGSFTAVVAFGGWLTGLVRWQNAASIRDRIDARLAAVEQRRLNDAYAEQVERARIAADMHDVVAHTWAVVAAQADGARYALRDSPEDAERALGVIADTARTTMSDLRRIVAELRGQQTPDDPPDREREEQLLARMRASGMRLESTTDGEPHGSPMVMLTAHRLLGEALTNALKHGDLGRPVVVHQDWRDGYALHVRNGIPVRSARPAPGGAGGASGHGRIGMAQRAAIAGGWLTSGAREGEWVVEARIPQRPSGGPAPGRPGDPAGARDRQSAGTEHREEVSHDVRE